MKNQPTITLWKAGVPILVFMTLLIYGLLLHPRLFGTPMLPIEVLILAAITFSCIYLQVLGFAWETIQSSIVKKVAESIPIVLILLGVGVLIGSWIVSGTIPMLIYYGISWVDPNHLYFFSFFICIVFSMLTGTSWGSAGTIGLVMISIGDVYGADVAINAAAIVGGSFFGDKLSPLSDTTNVAALASKVSLYEHIQSMLYTTVPSAIIAATLYWFLSPQLGDGGNATQLKDISATLTAIEHGFQFSPLLLLPILVVIYGSITKKSIFLTLLVASWVAMLCAFVFQDFGVVNTLTTLKSGFNVSMLTGQAENVEVLNILNRGGLFSLIDAIVIAMLVFVFIGTVEVIDALNLLLKALLGGIRKRAQLVATTLTATLGTNLLMGNQYATSFIIGAAFVDKFDELDVSRKVLSRSLEDAGTMMENLFPWTPSGIYMAAALGVSSLDYAPWQFLSLINIVIAYFFAFTGIACFGKREG